MAGNIYYNSVLNFLNIGSSYAIRGFMYLHSGDGNYAAQIVNSDASSVIFSRAIDGQHGDWVYFSAPFTATATASGTVMQAGYLRFTFTGTQMSWATFDKIEVSDNKDMLALGVVQIYPEWNMRRQTIQNRADHRTKGGKLYSYTWGEYEQFNIPLEYVQNSKAAIVNSWWSEDALIHFKIYSGGQWQVNCCHLMNDTAPFDERPKPYDQYRSGVLELETF